jgi:hypothetical protein
MCASHGELYRHPPHQRLHVTTADLAPLGSQHASQHPRSRKGELQMQSVETSHDREVGFRHRARQVVHAATADAQDLRLRRNGQSCSRSIIALRSVNPPERSLSSIIDNHTEVAVKAKL